MDKKKGVDVSQVTHTTATKGDDHRSVRPGVNYAGHCQNPSCRIKNEFVVHQRGVGRFIVNEDAIGNVAVCPKCNHPFAIKEVVLAHCTAKVIVHGQTSSTDTYKPRGDELVHLGANGRETDKSGKKDQINPSALPGLMRDTMHTSNCLVEIQATADKKADCVIC